jgi:hypothetical protein
MIWDEGPRLIASKVIAYIVNCRNAPCRLLTLKSQAGPPLDGLLTGVLRTMTHGCRAALNRSF